MNSRRCRLQAGLFAFKAALVTVLLE